MRRTLPFIFALASSACLPRPAPHDAAASDAAIGPPEVLGIEIVDRRGALWSDEIPQWPTLVVELSRAPLEPAPIWLFTGPADDDLSQDLADDPLRVATVARVVPSATQVDGSRVSLTPDARLAPGTVLTAGVAAWLRSSATDLKLGRPVLRELRVSGAPEAGARVTASWPPDGAAAVPLVLPSLVVRFDGPIEGTTEGIALLETGGEVPGAAAAVDCADHGFERGWCALFTPGRALAPSTEHRLVVSEAVLDATGAPVGPWEARFTTAADAEDSAPSRIALPCAIDELDVDGACVLADDAQVTLRVQLDEPVRIALSIAGRTLLAVAPRGSATLVASGLAPDTAYSASLRVEDLAGHVSEETLALRTTEPLATVSIVEVRADPNGPEPRQEYVEVLNYGPMTIDLAGMALSDREGALGDVVSQPQRLAPGQRALLVADAFDPEDPADDPVPPGVPLVRMGTSLGSGGLTNAGEPLFLRDASMRRLSAVPAMAAPRACVVRTGAEMRSADEAGFSIAPCTPGTAP